MLFQVIQAIYKHRSETIDIGLGRVNQEVRQQPITESTPRGEVTLS